MTHALRASESAMACLLQSPKVTAFLLPGIASTVCIVLLPKAGHVKPPNAALCAAIALLTCVLLSAMNPASIHASHLCWPQSHILPSKATDTLLALRRAAVNDVATTVAATPDVTSHKEDSDPDRQQAALFQLCRDSKWLRTTQQELYRSLALVLPQMCTHAAPSVRTATCSLLCVCLAELAVAFDKPLLDLFCRCMLQMARDQTAAVQNPAVSLCCSICKSSDVTPVPKVTASPAKAATKVSSIPSCSKENIMMLQEIIKELLPRCLAEFEDALIKPEAAVVASSRCLAAAMRALPPQHAARQIAGNPVALGAYIAAAHAYMRVDPDAASLWLQGFTSQRRLRARLSVSTAVQALRGQASKNITGIAPPDGFSHTCKAHHMPHGRSVPGSAKAVEGTHENTPQGRGLPLSECASIAHAGSDTSGHSNHSRTARSDEAQAAVLAGADRTVEAFSERENSALVQVTRNQRGDAGGRQSKTFEDAGKSDSTDQERHGNRSLSKDEARALPAMGDKSTIPAASAQGDGSSAVVGKQLRMPLGLKYIADVQVFAAAAEVPHSIGFVVASAWVQRTWPSGANAVLDHLRHELEESGPGEHQVMKAGPGASQSF
jgi:hypothetical protein